jgi:predicted GH43/DUF377 family glycosyl hydrolase
MKYAYAVLCLILLGCVDSGVKVTDDSLNTTTGKISFSMAKAAIPANVSSLTFTLTNLSTAETVSKTVSVTSDSFVQVLFDKVTVGQWHVKVVALEASGATQYSGEADAAVTVGQLTQLNIILNTATTTGGLLVTVIWNGATPFYDNPTNPILVKRGAWYDTRGVENATVMFDGTKYKMWFLNFGIQGNIIGSIGMAESVDGTTWTRVADTVMMPVSNSWESMVVAPGTVLKENGIYTMYYTGEDGSGFNIGRAVSQDGQHWTRMGKVMPGVSNIAQPGVVKANNQYYMYYHTYPSVSLNLATSPDGVTWTPYSGNPVVSPAQSWEGYGLAYASVVYENSTFTMMYSNTNGTQSFGLATSTDGTRWTKDPRNPVFSRANTVNGWATGSIGYPFFTRVGTELRVYYTGVSGEGVDRIGYAVKR